MSRVAPLGMLLFVAAIPAHGAASEVLSEPADRQSLAVTVYNEDLGLVRELRQVALPQGRSRLALAEVSPQIRPETALLSGLDPDRSLDVMALWLDSALLSPQTLLKRYVGRQVGIVKTHPRSGEETVHPATLLAIHEGVVLKIGEHIETGIPGRIVYPDLPADLRRRPTLVAEVESAGKEPQTLQLSYLTGGLSWQADYVAELDQAQQRMDLMAWATVTNNSGIDYPDAELKFVAGDVHQVRGQPPGGHMAERAVMAKATPAMTERGLADYHLYTLDRRATLGDGQTKQLALLRADDVSVDKHYVLQGQPVYYRDRYEPVEDLNVDAMLETRNTDAHNLGLPLPRGIVRFYGNGQGPQFIGEDRLDHTPEGAVIRLRLGAAFDIRGQRRQTAFDKIGGSRETGFIYETAHAITLTNAKDETATVRIREPIPGDWRILKESHTHEELAANLVEWRIEVPARGEATLAYRARVEF